MTREQCLRVFQNNKALKPHQFISDWFFSLRVFQNNKALKLVVNA